MALVLVEKTNDTARVTFNRPKQLNALSPELLKELIVVANELQQSDAKLISFEGAGSAFSAGADLKAFFEGIASKRGGEIADIGRKAADAIAALPQVTVALIDGPCIGGGLVLATCCDLRWASARSTFSLPEVNLGFPVGWGGTARVAAVVGIACAKALVLECLTLSAQSALQAGLISQVFEDDFESQARTALGKLNPLPAQTLRYCKEQFNAIESGLF